MFRDIAIKGNKFDDQNNNRVAENLQPKVYWRELYRRVALPLLSRQKKRRGWEFGPAVSPTVGLRDLDRRVKTCTDHADYYYCSLGQHTSHIEGCPRMDELDYVERPLLVELF